MNDGPVSYRDIERLDGEIDRVWTALDKKSDKEDVNASLATKADRVIVDRIDKNVRLLVWIGVLVILGLFTAGAGLIANLIAHA